MADVEIGDSQLGLVQDTACVLRSGVYAAEDLVYGKGLIRGMTYDVDHRLAC